jgi:two-component system, NtrC family, response regulator GlrR
VTFRELLNRYEQDLVLEYLEKAQGNIAEAARMADLSRQTFYNLVQKHHIDATVFKP